MTSEEVSIMSSEPVVPDMDTSNFSDDPEDLNTQTCIQNRYVFWYMKRTSANKAVNKYEDSVKLIASFQTIEHFWRVYDHLIRPNDQKTSTIDYHLFKNGIKPTWEDPQNLRGGKWIVRLKKGLASKYWEELIIAIIGEQFDVGSEICGAVISMRHQEDILSVWNKSAENIEATNKIRDQLRRLLKLPSFISIEYKKHQDSMTDKSSFRNTVVWRGSSSTTSNGPGGTSSSSSNTREGSTSSKSNKAEERTYDRSERPDRPTYSQRHTDSTKPAPGFGARDRDRDRDRDRTSSSDNVVAGSSSSSSSSSTGAAAGGDRERGGKTTGNWSSHSWKGSGGGSSGNTATGSGDSSKDKETPAWGGSRSVRDKERADGDPSTTGSSGWRRGRGGDKEKGEEAEGGREAWGGSYKTAPGTSASANSGAGTGVAGKRGEHEPKRGAETGEDFKRSRQNVSGAAEGNVWRRGGQIAETAAVTSEEKPASSDS